MPHSQGPSNNPYREQNQFNSSYFLKIHSNIIPHLRLSFPKGRIPAGVPVKFWKELLPSSILATRPTNLSFLDLIILTILGERYKLWNSSLWSLPHLPFASLLDPNIHLRILFSNTLSLCSSLSKRPSSMLHNHHQLLTIYSNWWRNLKSELLPLVALNKMLPVYQDGKLAAATLFVWKYFYYGNSRYMTLFHSLFHRHCIPMSWWKIFRTRG